ELGIVGAATAGREGVAGARRAGDHIAQAVREGGEECLLSVALAVAILGEVARGGAQFCGAHRTLLPHRMRSARRCCRAAPAHPSVVIRAPDRKGLGALWITF